MIAYFLQIACLVALAEVLLRIVPVASAGFRYAYWRIVLANALAVPWILRPSTAVSPAPITLPMFPVPSTAAAPEVAGVAAAGVTEWLPLVFVLAAAGALARLTWVTVGLVRLDALRRRGTPAADAIADEIQQRLGTRAEIRAVPNLAQPVTFGLRRPVVLVPEGLADLPESVRRAALAHELLHVRRRDWAWVLFEEGLRVVFWFHPAIWWATSRIRLTREEFTDHLAVLTVGGRRAYVDALLAFADHSHVQPAPAFARRADLFHRIVLLTKEPAMTARRIVASGIVLTALLAAGGVMAAEIFPVPVSFARASVAAAALAQAASTQANRVTPENPIPRRIYSVPIPYPIDMRGSGVKAALSLPVVIDAAGVPVSVTFGSGATTDPNDAWRAARGGVSDRSVIPRTMESFRAAAADAIMQWRYDSPAQAPLLFWVGVTFDAEGEGRVSQHAESTGVSASQNEARLGSLPMAFGFPPIATTAPGARGRGQGVAGTSDAGPGAPAAGTRVAPPSPGTLARPDALPQSNQVVTDANGNRPVRTSSALPRQITKVAPVYPLIARSARVQGEVILELTVDAEGNVADARVLRSIPLLDRAALDAVKQWRYEPTRLNGVPTPVILTVTVPFRLDDQPGSAPQQ